MAAIREPLSEFIPELPELRGIVSRFSARMGEDGGGAWPQYLSYLGESAVDSVKWAITEKGVKNRSGHLLDSVKFDMSMGEYGTVSVDAIYASALDEGMDIKEHLLGRVIGMTNPGPGAASGTVFRTVTDTPNLSRGFRNWEIAPFNFMMLAKQITPGSVIQTVEEIKNLASPESASQYQLPAEELPEISKETWYSLTRIPEYGEVSRTDRELAQEVEKTPYRESSEIPILGIEATVEQSMDEFDAESQFISEYLMAIAEIETEDSLEGILI